MGNKTNAKLRAFMCEHDTTQWQLADRMHVSDSTMSRWFREELPDDIQDLMCEIVKGNTQHVPKVKEYFKKRTLARDKEILEHNIDNLMREVSDREFERELERDQEREEWLFEERKRHDY